MGRQRLVVFELAPAADELWELVCDRECGFLEHRAGCVVLPDVAAGAKLRPRVTATYASGKATNIARVFEGFLCDRASALGEKARGCVLAELVTCLPGCPGEYSQPQIPGPLLSRFTPGGAYMACLQARDFERVGLRFEALPPTAETQVDRRCANIVAPGGAELANFSPYILWDRAGRDTAVKVAGSLGPVDVVGLAGSLPRVDGQADAGVYADIIAAIRGAYPEALISLDVGGAPVEACLRGGRMTSPDVLSVNMDEYASVPSRLWEAFRGSAVIHNKRGCWWVRGEGPSRQELDARGPDVRVPEGVVPRQTICAGDAAHGGLLLGLMLYGRDDEGFRRSLVLSQACALAVVENEGGIRALSGSLVEANLARLG